MAEICQELRSRETLAHSRQEAQISSTDESPCAPRQFRAGQVGGKHRPLNALHTAAHRKNKFFACGCGSHPAGVTFEQTHAKSLFESPNPSTERRLADALRARREPEICPVCDRDEESKVRDIHDGRECRSQRMT